MPSKKRLDQLLVESGMVQTRQRAQAVILAGKVLVDNQPVDKPGSKISCDATIVLKEEDHPYVSRGGVKLNQAINTFKIDVKDKICMDVGASTGGFTDCLLQYHAKMVYAVDVGYGQLAWKLRCDSRVIVIERTNIRHLELEKIADPISIATIDVSFISLKIVVPKVKQFLTPNARVIALIKPQFEVGKGEVGKKGVVRDTGLHTKVIDDLTQTFIENGFSCNGVIDSPILGPKGNKEFLINLYFNN